MKQGNVDFVVDECRHIIHVILAEHKVEDLVINKIIEEFDRRIRDEYKYLLRGPR